MRWGDSLDEDLGDDLPADSIVGPDAKGVKIVTQYRKNDKGDTVKTVIKTKFTKVERKVYKVLLVVLAAVISCAFVLLSFQHSYLRAEAVVLVQSALERREWKRFGDAVAQQPEHSVTVQSREDVPFERTKAQKSTRDEKQQLSLQSAMQSNDKNAVTAKYALFALQSTLADQKMLSTHMCNCHL